MLKLDKNKSKLYAGLVVLIISSLLIFGSIFIFNKKNSKEKTVAGESDNEQGQNVNPEKSEDSKMLFEAFNSSFTLKEVGQMDNSESMDWWLNAGGTVYINGNYIKTAQGDLEETNQWYRAYKKNNPRDTDGGKHPQNIFRLVTRKKFKILEQQAYFKINKNNLSQSEYRNASNGILLFNRYQDGDNLYYTGLRVDGTVVIKKKIHGTYFVLDQNVFYPGKYDREKNPNLLPIGKWIGVKSEVQDNLDGTISIKLYIDKNHSGNWVLALTAIDNGKSFGGASIKKEGYAGIRTDFMDVEFDNYKIEEITE